MYYFEASATDPNSLKDKIHAKTWFHVKTTSKDSNSAQPLATISPTGLTPTQIKGAYNLPATGGNGTIAIVDAYDCPTAQTDLEIFSQQFGLPSPNFEKHKMTPSIPVDSGWALEISLDIQWAHAIAPNAKILLVEARSASIGDLLSAVNYARSRSDVVAISMSWGTNEFSTETLYNSYFTSNHGVVFFASSGDSGAGVIWPSSSPNVVAVGGTRLSFFTNGSFASETGWSGSGGGVSAYEVEPSYQISYNVSMANGKRAVPDVSYDADPASGFSVYNTTPYNGQTGWFVVGGTSAGSPQWAAIHSLALSTSNANFYQDSKYNSPGYFRDITSGSNGAYSAAQGYDLVTGLGSPVTFNYTTGIGSNFSISLQPTNVNVVNGSRTSSNISIASLKGFYGTIGLSTNASSGWNLSFNQSSVAISAGGTATSVLTIIAPSNATATAYNFAIKGSSGSQSHNISLAVNVQTLPSPPRNLNSTGAIGKIILNWTAPVNNGGFNLTNYTVYRGITNTSLTKLAVLNANSFSYVDTGAASGQVYFYQVTANNSIGESAKSALSSNMTLSPSSFVISGFTVVNGGSGYTTPAVILSGGGGSGASATARVSNGVIYAVVLTNPGIGYASTPTVTFSDPNPRAQGGVANAIMAPA